ncbi:glycosyl hydrolase family 18 protein [Desertibacillus haloalkaliphilus]|uniref:glycosyl hydrolase family 18 protein n=1 Tax=Desertibacillus haloalkaliphilus TaxID=1328930 RepID=UPI001C26B4EB|nr:glycoside hydrolase family 18 protein [Desertibacillus haloalkaliphilus]MBU8907941.1 glycoside hydrolase family 18 protein [Desertibacillus haloalkaliphilus]
MQIHVVSPGESLWGISQAYQIPYQQIIEANQLPNPEQLVVGQAIVIPVAGRFHWVQQGETVWQLSQRYQVPVEHILAMNHIQFPQHIPEGYRLYVPESYHRQQPAIDVGAYVDLGITGEESPEVVAEVAEHLTFLQIFSYELNRDGSLTPINDQVIINTAYEDRVVPLMVITNIEDGQFSTEVATAVLQSEELQNKLLDEAIAIMEQRGYLGLDFDLEYLGAENREPYNELMRKAKSRLEQRGFYLSSALAPQVEPGMPGVLYEGHDYAAHGEIADFVFLMTYEWGWTGGPPMAVAPISQVRRVIEYAASVVPNDKIMMGVPLYGYDWTLPFVEGETRARAIDHQEAIELAARYNAAIEYDWEAQSPFFTYVDEEGLEHEVWFEDARSIQAKFDLVKEMGLRGLYYWVLGWEFPQNWLLLEDNFTINKRV